MAFVATAGTALIGAGVAYGANKLLNSGASNASQNANQAVSDSTGLQNSIATDQWNRYKDIYSPLQAKVVSEAQNYDTPEQYAKAAGDASATVSDQFGKARDQLTRTPGLDPSSPAYTASMAGLDSAQAATDATAQNTARLNVQNTAWGRQTGALATGNAMPTGALTGLNGSNYANLGLASLNNGIASKNAQAVGGLTSSLTSPAMVNSVKGWLGSGTTTTIPEDPAQTAANQSAQSGYSLSF